MTLGFSTDILINKCEIQAVSSACDLLYSSSIFSRGVFSALLEYGLVVGFYLGLSLFIGYFVKSMGASLSISLGKVISFFCHLPIWFYGFKDIYLPLLWLNLELALPKWDFLALQYSFYGGYIVEPSFIARLADVIVFWN